MAMTLNEYEAKIEISRILRKQGYKSYARLFDLFDLNFTDDPGVVAYMEPGKGRIVINRQIDDEDTISLLIRHEILHEYLDHALRAEEHIGKDAWEKRTGEQHQNFNKAADWELSNKGYTARDRYKAKHIRLGDQELEGLVLQIDHPEWTTLTMEEIYDKLEKEREEAQKDAKSDMQDNQQQEEQQGDRQDQDSDGQGSSGKSAEQDSKNQSSQSSGKSSSSSGSQGQSQGNTKPSPSKSGSGSGKPQIGDTGDEQIQQAEEMQRQLDDISDMLDSYGDQLSDDEKLDKLYDDLEQLEKATDQVKKEVEQNKKDAGHFKDVTDEIKQQRTQKKLDQIQKELDKLADSKALIKEVDAKKMADTRAQARREAERYKNSPINKFKMDLYRLMNDEVGMHRGSSWAREDQRYAGTGLLHPGRVNIEDERETPLVVVFFDQSASWSDEDIKVGMDALYVLNEFVRQGDIKLEIYYFANTVSPNVSTVRGQGGTGAGREIMDYIGRRLQPKPSNVIIMTDSDIDGQGGASPAVTVDGGVFLLFRDGKRCKALINNLHGRKGDYYYDI